MREIFADYVLIYEEKSHKNSFATMGLVEVCKALKRFCKRIERRFYYGK